MSNARSSEMPTTKRRPRTRLQRNEHGGPQLPLDPGDHSTVRVGGEKPVISAVPEYNGDFTKGYVWIGSNRGCFGTIETRDLLAFADAIRRATA